MKAELEESFESFAAATADRWYRVAYAITRDHELAGEAVSSALAAAYARWHRVHTDADNFVRRTLVHDVIGWARRRGTPSQPHDAVRIRRRADRELADADAVWAALRELPVGQRAVIVLRYYERLSEADVAHTLAIRPDLVHAQTSAALVDLRRQMTLARQRARA
jgi:RNA polymerase sigma-70 factor (ECF subfamily)